MISRCAGIHQAGFILRGDKTDELSIKNDELSVKNDNLFIQNDEFCIKNDGFADFIRKGEKVVDWG